MGGHNLHEVGEWVLCVIGADKAGALEQGPHSKVERSRRRWKSEA
jgi:hypothetical protein